MSRPPSPHATIEDPEQRWARIRASWLAPSPATSSSTRGRDNDQDAATPAPTSLPSPDGPVRKPKDAVFQHRIRTLETMLRSANSIVGPGGRGGGGGPAPRVAVPALVESSDKGNNNDHEERGECDEPDDGFAIARGGDKKSSTQELQKVSEGIFLAFKQGRALKEALPLSLVTSLLFRSWLLDGTIPLDYSQSLAEPDPPMPMPVPIPQTTRPPPDCVPSKSPPQASTIPHATTTTMNNPVVNRVLEREGRGGGRPSLSPASSDASSSRSIVADDVTPSPLGESESPLELLSRTHPSAVTRLNSGGGGGGGGAASSSSNNNNNNALTEVQDEDDVETGGRREPYWTANSTTTTTETDARRKLVQDGDGDEREQMPPPPVPVCPRRRGIDTVQQQEELPCGGGEGGGYSTASLVEGMGPDETSGKLKLDVLRGSRWRTERDIASGSDII